MKLLNERNQVLSVLDKWCEWAASIYQNSHRQRITEQLGQLNLAETTAKDIENIIGNDSWCHPYKCNECGESSWDIVELGEEPDYESATVWICASCLEKALALVAGKIDD